MKTQVSRKTFLLAAATTTFAGVLGCSGEEAGTSGGDGDGDGDNTSGTGSSTGTGGDAAGTGGDAAGTGGDAAGTGGDAAGTGGDAAGTGGDAAGTGGESGGLTCSEDILVTSSGDGHTHTLLLTAAQMNAGAEVTLTSSPGGGDHTHCVTLTVGELATIKAGGTVKKTTCNGGDHEFVISCDPAADLPVVPSSCVDEAIGDCN